MIEINITAENAGQRIDKFILKLLPGMSKSFSYKMYRKKNITLNKSKIKGSEILRNGDAIQIFFSDDTYKKFCENEDQDNVVKSMDTVPIPEVIFEDEHLLVINKSVGVFSQPDERGVGINQQIKAYYDKNCIILPEGFKPGVANRLDRNTSGVIISAKDIPTIQQINELIMSHQVKKIYRTIVKGQVLSEKVLEGYLEKKQTRNRVSINNQGQGAYIHTTIKPIRTNGDFTELEVQIQTGKPHQIRAHLAIIGHPIIGDGKYGHKDVNKMMRQEYNLRHQLLHAYYYKFEGESELSQRYHEGFTAVMSPLYESISKGLF